MLSHVVHQQGYQYTKHPTELDHQKTDDNDDGSSHPYAIKRLKVDDPEYISELPERFKSKDFPTFPTTVGCFGEPGSGKTNVLLNMLTSPKLWKGFYDMVYLFGPTTKTDKLYKLIKIDKEQIVANQEDFVPKLEEYLAKQIEDVEKNAKEANKTLFVFEDITSYFHGFQSSEAFGKSFTAIRHHKATAYAHAHKVKGLNRTARMALQHIILFPLNKTEIDVIYHEWAPRTLLRHQWDKLVEDAWTPDGKTEKPFLYINKDQPIEKRYRKCFTHQFDLEFYKKIEKPGKPLPSRKGVKEEVGEDRRGQRVNKRQEGLEDDRRKLREHYLATQRSKGL